MPLVYNEEKGVWEFGEDPKFKTKSEAQAYSNNRQSSLQDSIRRSMGVGPSDLQNLARESGTKKALEEQGYDYDEMFEATPYTPGGTSGGYEAPELKGEEAAAYQKASEELGYRPGVYSDTQDLLAEDQGNVSQIVNGTIKLAGKTATNVAGSIIGTAYGIGSAIVNGSFSSFYDNDFQRALDEANAAMDEYLPNYVRKEVEDYSLLEQMGTTNFWANDFLGGMSFVAGAVISEYLTAGLASSMIIPRAAKTLKFVDKAEDVAKGYQAAAFGRNIGLGVTDKTLKNLGNFARQTAVGSFYEAGVEARHFVDEAKKNYISEMQQKEGRDPFAEELSAFMDNAHIVGNSLFAANAALVSLNNIVTLPNSFGPGLTKRFGKGASQDVANKSAFNKGIFGTKEANVIPTKSLSAKELKTAAANLKVSVDDVKAMTVINKKALRSTSKLGKTLNGLRTTGKILEQGFAEGVWEEGMQGALSGGALEYVTNFYDPEAKDNNLSVMSAFASGLHEAYGTKEGLKEIVIGAILGLTGFAGPGGWQGGIYGTIKEEKQKQNQIDKLVETVNQSKDFGSIFKGMYLAGQQRLVATKKMDKAAELNDMFKYKNAENDAFMGYVLGRTEAGMYDSIEEDLVNTVNKMSNEEFAQEFGYENMTNDEITKRKNEAVVETKARAKQIRDGLLTAKNITNSEDVALNHGLAWTISTLDNIDRREASLGELVSTYAGRSIRNEDLKNYIQIGVALDDTKAIKEYTRIIGEINKKNLQKADGTFSQMWMGRETTLIGDRVKIDRLDKEIAELQKQKRELAKEMLGILKKGSSLTYNNDVDAFGQDLDIFLDTKDQINLQAKRPTFAERAGTPQDPRKVYEDLKKLAKYREQVITEYNFFLSKEGRKDFVSTINNINKLADRERLFEEFAIAASVTPITSDTKVREIQEAAFRIRGNSFITQAIKEEKAAEMVPADNTLANLNSRVQKSDASEQFKSWMADFKKGHDELLKTDQIKELLNFCKTKLAEAKKFANSFEGTQEGDNFKEFLDTNALQNRIKEIEDFLKAQGVPVTKSTGGFVPIIEKSSQLHTVKPDTKSKEAMEILKSLTAADVKNFKDVTIELVTDSEGGKIVNPQDAEGNEVEQGVKIRKGYNNKQQQLAVKYKGTIIGYIYDPNRYQFDDGAGGLRNFNKTAADLEKLNPAFVQMENGVMVPSALGDDFINTYNALTSFWTIADKAFESNLTLPSDLLDKFLFLNHSVKYLSNASESLDSISSNPNLQIKDPKGNSTRPIIFRQSGQNIFVYNEDTKNYELVSPDDYEYYYNNYIDTSKNNINNLSNQYVIVGNPEADVHVIGLSYTEVPVTESIVENIQDTYGAFKEDVERKVKEGAKTENDLDIFPVNAGFIAAKNAAGVRISLSFSKFQSTQKTKEGKIIPKPNLVVQLYTRANRNAGKGGTYFNLYRDKENNKPVSSIRLVEGVGLFFKDKDKTNTSTRINNNEELAKALTIAISDRLEAYGEEGLEITAFQQMPEIREENNEGKNVVVGLETDKLNVRVDLMSSLSFRPKGITPASSASAPSKPKGNADSELAKKIIAEIDKINTTTADDQEVAKELLDAIEKAVKGQPTVSALIATKVGALKAYINKVFTSPSASTLTPSSFQSETELQEAYNDRAAKEEEANKRRTEIYNEVGTGWRKALGTDPQLQAIIKDIENLTKKIQELEATGPAFKIEENPDGELIDFEQAFINLSRILPTNVISFKELDTIRRNLKRKGQTSGAFFNKIVYLARNASKGTEYHEAFHAVVRTFLTAPQLNLLYKEASIRYGKPTKEQLTSLKNKAGDYQNLTARQLELLWYEEQMADEFQSYAVKRDKEYKGVKGIIKMIFDKIKRFAQWVTNSKADIDVLFNNIYEGQFKTAKEVNDFPLFFGRDIEVYKLLPKKFGIGYLDATTSLIAYNRVVKEVLRMKDEGGLITDDKVQDALESVINRYYDIESDDLIYGEILDRPSTNQDAVLKTVAKLEEIKAGLDGLFERPKDLAQFIYEVKRRASSVKFEENIDEEEYVEDETSADLGIKDNRTLGGLGSTSKQMREYMALMEVPIDEFNLGLTEEELNSGVFTTYVNPQELYTSVEAIMTNTWRPDMLKKLSYHAQDNIKIYHFYNNLARDIKSELGRPELSNEELANLPISELFKSNKFNLFISNFNKYKANQITVLADPRNGLFKVFRTNMYDVQEKQVESWSKNWRANGFNDNPGEAKVILESLQKSLKSYTKLLNPNTAEEYVNQIQAAFDALGIKLAKNYIRYSLAYANIVATNEYDNAYNRADSSTAEYLDKLKDNFELFSGVEVFDEATVQGIIESLKSGSPFLVDSTVNAFDEADNLEQVKDANTAVSGAVGRLKTMALGNSYFDETVGSTTVQNADGENQYTHLAPNFFLIQTLFYQNPQLRQWVFTEDREEGLQQLRDAFNAMERNVTDYQLESFYDAVKGNPMLNAMITGEGSTSFPADRQKTANRVFQNFKVEFNDGLRRKYLDTVESADRKTAVVAQNYRESNGNVFFDLDTRATVYTMMAYFASDTGNTKQTTVNIPGQGEVRVTPFIPLQIEAKNTQIAVMMPVNKLADNNYELNSSGQKMLVQHFMQEYNRISKISKEIAEDTERDRVDEYNIKMTDRGVDFFNFKKLSKTNPSLYNTLLNAARAGEALPISEAQLQDELKKFFTSEYNEFKELLGEENLTYTDKEGNTRVNILPNYYKTSDSTLNESSTAEFFYNSYINSLNYNNLMFGDLAYNFKNPIDFVKRMAGPNAAGPSIGYGETNVAILEDVYNENGTETTNAQAYTYPFWYTDTYLQSLGKNSTAVKQIWDRITKGYPLSAAEVAKLKEEGAMANPRKLTTFDLFLYGKKSVKVLIRSEASNFKGGEKARKYVDTLYDRIKRLDRNTDEYREIVREIQSYWVAKPGRENLHSKLNKLELQNIGLAIHASGVKGAKTNVNEIDAAEYSTLVVNNQFIREQVATNSIKDKIVHGTQLMQLISSEHADNTEVIFRGKNTDIGTLRRYYRELLGNRVLDSFMLMRDSIVDGDIAKYKYLLKSFEGSLIESGADPVLMEQFRAAYAQADMPEYNLNMPSVEQKFEAMFLSYMSKGVLSQKVPGHKLTLTSDEGYDVLRDKNGNVLPDNLPLDAVTAYQNDGAQFTKLRYHQKDNEKNVYYAECLISGQLLTELGLRPGDEIPSYMLELVGVRIPTQDKHSMVYLKVVGVLPAETGNQIVMPADILDLSGADFDIDSEFVRIPDFYRDENNNILIYGDYLKSEKPLITAFNEFVQSIKKQDKRVKQDIKDFELSDENYIKLIEERNALKLRLKSIKTDIQNNYDDIALAMNLEPTVEDEIEDFSNAEDVIANLKTVGIGLNQEQKNIITEIGDKNKQIKSAKKEIVAKVLEKNNHPSTQESFDYKYGKQVADNVKAFNEGKIDEIKPITVNEINNLTLDIEKSLIYNEGNSDVATSPADDKLAQDFMKKYFNAEGEDSSNKFDNPADIKTASSPTDILKANASNSIGKDNVGIAALWNVMYSYLRNYNIPLIKEVEKDNKTILNASGIDQDIIDIVTSPFNTDVTTDKSETRNRVRVVHINSTQITLAVDNAKFQYASFFNLSTDNLGSTLILTSKGLSFDRAMLLNIQPALLEYSKRAKVVSGQLKTEVEERVTKSGVIKDLLSEYASELKDIKPEKAGQVELTVENLYQAKLFGEGKPSTLEKWQYLEIQLKALEVFNITNEESSFLRDLGNVLSLIKGAKTDFVEMNGISESLKKLGIQLVLKKGAKGFEPSDYEIRHVSNFKDLAVPYDVLPILTQDGLVKTNLQVFAAIMRIAEDFVITQSKFALNTSERVKLSFKTKKSGNVLNYSDKAKTLKNHMIAFLASKAYAKKSGKKFTFDTLFAEPGNLTRLSELVREAYRNDELKKNHFIKYLTPERTSYEGKTDSTFFGKALQKFVGQTRTKKDATFKQQLSNAFTELQSGEFSDPNTKQIARELSGLLLEYLFVKDGLLFRNKSFISEIDPKHFKRVSESLFDVQAVLSGKKAFQDIFGVDQATLEQEFVEKFARYQGNAFDLISNSYVNIVGNMRKNKIDQLKEAAKATGLDEELLEGQSASEIVKILQTLQESEALDSINKDIMPLTIDKETGVLTVNLFAGTKKKDFGFDSLDSNNTPVIKSNFQALLSTGLFVPMKGMINGKSQNRIGFPEFISITYKGGGKQIYKLIKTEKTKKDKELKGVSAPYDFGFGATYMPVSTLGTQEVLPYAIDLDEHARMEGEAELLRMSKSSSKAAETSEQKPAESKSLFNFSRESKKEESKELPAEPPTISSFNPLSSNPISGMQPNTKKTKLDAVFGNKTLTDEDRKPAKKLPNNISFEDESDDIPC
jgi:hypothetical protein